MTRLEWQLRAAALSDRWKTKKHEDKYVYTIHDWLAKRQTILEYLMDDWLVFIEPKGFDRRHPERAKTHPHWRRAADAFQRLGTIGSTAQGPCVLSPRPQKSAFKRQQISSREQRIKAITGSLVALAEDVDQIDISDQQALDGWWHQMTAELQLGLYRRCFPSTPAS